MITAARISLIPGAIMSFVQFFEVWPESLFICNMDEDDTGRVFAPMGALALTFLLYRITLTNIH